MGRGVGPGRYPHPADTIVTIGKLLVPGPLRLMQTLSGLTCALNLRRDRGVPQSAKVGLSIE